jgi:hypothetical protein
MLGGHAAAAAAAAKTHPRPGPPASTGSVAGMNVLVFRLQPPS